MKRAIVILICAVTALANGATAISQDQQQEPAQRRAPRVGVRMGGGPSQVIVPGEREVHFVGAELSFSGKLVKGAPYSAEAVTEHVQMLADGNRIVRRSAAAVYRDTEGRTRHEQTLRSVGPYAVAGDPPQMVFINDPVAGFNYILNPRDRSARKIGRPQSKIMGEGGNVAVWVGEPEMAEKMAREEALAAGARLRSPAPPVVVSSATAVTVESGEAEIDKPKTESLGKQMIEGVEAEGTRTTITIPAGKIGNEMPILIISESWYSPELQVVVMTRHSDPRFGEQSYRLTGINRSEPAKSLFEVPSDYTVKESVPNEMRMKVERELQRERQRQKQPNEQ
ncbi:MAG TPA: hypothetical protein VFQ92_11565 [Blastocatellia bacterium]|nr:hypothetical protein [Blastocatellia bacterium]